MLLGFENLKFCARWLLSAVSFITGKIIPTFGLNGESFSENKGEKTSILGEKDLHM